MTNATWIEPPPPQRGMGCFGKGCLILVIFFVVLGAAFVGGTYFAASYLRRAYFPTTHVQLPATAATQEQQDAVRARWNKFEKAARAHEPARIELTAEDLNALVASNAKLRGNAFVSVEDNVCRLQLSIPLGDVSWLRGHYLNAECAVQAAADGNPDEARVTSIVVNGRAVGEDVLDWQYRSWSFRRYMSDWTERNDLKTFQIADDKIILETKGSE